MPFFLMMEDLKSLLQHLLSKLRGRGMIPIIETNSSRLSIVSQDCFSGSFRSPFLNQIYDELIKSISVEVEETSISKASSVNSSSGSRHKHPISFHLLQTDIPCRTNPSILPMKNPNTTITLRKTVTNLSTGVRRPIIN